VAFFYEIRSPDNTVLKRTGGFPDREAATLAAREDAKRLRAAPKPPTVSESAVWNAADHVQRAPVADLGQAHILTIGSGLSN